MLLRVSGTARQFAYWLDPAPLAALSLYLINRFLLKPAWSSTFPFLRDYLNDVLCIPLFVPAVLFLHRRLGFRTNDTPPTAFELLFHLAIWSVCFEVIAPRLSSLFRTTADPLDVAAYAVGTGLAGLCWRSWRGPAAAAGGTVISSKYIAPAPRSKRRGKPRRNKTAAVGAH